MAPSQPTTSPSATRADDRAAPRRLDAKELEQLADRLIELMKREIRLDREREGKTR